MGRVENRLSPALPHQTVHAVLPHTAFRCSSYRGMRRFPARACRNLVQPIAPVKIMTRKAAEAASSVRKWKELAMPCLGFMKKVITHGSLFVVAVTCIFVATPTQATQVTLDTRTRDALLELHTWGTLTDAMADIPAGSFLMGTCKLNDKIIEE